MTEEDLLRILKEEDSRNIDYDTMEYNKILYPMYYEYGISKDFKVLDVAKELYMENNIFTILFTIDDNQYNILFPKLCKINKIHLYKKTGKYQELYPYSTSIIHCSLLDYQVMCECVAYDKEINSEVENKIKNSYKKSLSISKKVNLDDEL